MTKARVAIVGSGISGLGTAYSLLRDPNCDVTLFEKRSRLGGHTFTHSCEDDDHPSDLGFQVFNLTNYPYLTELFKDLGVESEPSSMSFSFSVDEGRLEWASNKQGLRGILAQPGNLFNPKFIYMIREAIRFGKVAGKVLEADYESISLGEFLQREGFGKEFLDLYLLPMTAAVWSVPGTQMLKFPVKTFVAFWKNHHLLNPLGARPVWRVCKKRSIDYLQRIIDSLEAATDARVRRGEAVVAIRKEGKGVELETSKGRRLHFDKVVFACHSNQVLSILKHPNSSSFEESSLLAKIKYQKNEVVLHSDERLMPKARAAWASWNVMDRSGEQSRDVCVTYWLNLLQNYPAGAPLKLCTLNPIKEIPEEKILYKCVLEHPVFDLEMLKARDELNDMQQDISRKVFFAGAYLGSGFHEDGLASAVRVAKIITGREPCWINSLTLKTPSPVLSVSYRLVYSLFRSVFSRGICQGHLKIVLPNGKEDVYGTSKQEAVAQKQPCLTMYVKDMSVFYRFLKDADVGLGEAFIEDLFDMSFYDNKMNESVTVDLDGLNFSQKNDELLSLFKILILNAHNLRNVIQQNALSAALSTFGRRVLSFLHALKKNTVRGSRRNIEAHYDLGNSMYELFLDQTMTYSSGIFREGCGLKQSQYNKMDRIIDTLGITSSDLVLEIGCGWGSFAIRAAQRVGCKVIGITISTEQLALANERVKEAGLQDQVLLCICDYRKLGSDNAVVSGCEDAPPTIKKLALEKLQTAGSFDKVVSIEMIEAVGHEHLPNYFATIDRMLADSPSSKAAIQAISVDQDRYMRYMSGSDFIRRHIFPGGHLVCLDAIKWSCASTSLALEEAFDIGPHYATTLNCWKNNFIAHKEKILSLGYPVEFIKKWMFYFSYCEAGFELGYIRNFQLLLVKDSGRNAKMMQSYLNEEKSLTFGLAASKEAADASQLPMVSTLVPAAFWLLAWMANHTTLKMISTIAVLAVFLTSFALSFVQGKYSADFVRAASDAQFAFLVIATVPLSFVFHPTFNNLPEVEEKDINLTLDSWFVLKALLFSSFGRLAAANGRSLKGSLPYLAHSCCLVITAFLCFKGEESLPFVSMSATLLHGMGEVHSFLFNLRKFESLKGASFQQEQSFRNLCGLEALSLPLKGLPMLIFILFNMGTLFSSIPFLGAVGGLLWLDVSSAVASALEVYEEYENGVNTGALLQYSRSKENLIAEISGQKKSGRISSIYKGFVSHARSANAGQSRTSSAHSFKYKVWMALLDLKEVEDGTAFADSPLISLNRYNFFSFHREDYYMPVKNQRLSEAIRGLVLRNVGITVTGNILLLTNLRCLGYVFNSLSVFYCFDDQDTLVSVVLEVSNTPWLCKRQYVLKNMSPDGATFTARFQKDFHVSPFLDVFYDYEWVLTPPNLTEGVLEARAVSSRRKIPEVDLLSKDFVWKHTTGDAKVKFVKAKGKGKVDMRVGYKLHKSQIQWLTLLQQPVMTFLAHLFIHWEAAKVMMKGGRYQRTPANQRKVGFSDARHNLYVVLVSLAWLLLSLPFKACVTVTDYVSQLAPGE